MTKVSFTAEAARLSILDGRKQEEIKTLSMIVDRMPDEKYDMPRLLQRAAQCITELWMIDADIRGTLSLLGRPNELRGKGN